jgi:hypothetical protein
VIADSNLLVFITVIGVCLTSTFILVTRDWRYSIGVLAIQYIGVFILVNASWLIEMAVVKMVAGWMAGAILGIAMSSIPDVLREYETRVALGPGFRIISAIILALTITSLVLHSGSWFSMISTPILWGSFILIGFGILQLSLTSHPFTVIIGLLTSLSGFEIIYAAIETSSLVTGLLAGVTLGIALVGSYMIIAPTMESIH